MQHVLQYYYNITLNKSEYTIRNPRNNEKFDSGGLIRGLQRPHVSNMLFLPFSMLSDGAMECSVTVNGAVYYDFEKINILEYA